MTAFGETLHPGDMGPGVVTLERHLVRAGKELNFRSGYFNDQMEEAVRDFQSDQGLTVDGIVGPETQSRFISVNQYSNGDTGEGVEELQASLNQFTIECEVDSIYGPETEEAVTTFQEHNEIEADGIAGSVTFDTLDKALNVTGVSNGDSGTIFASVVRAVQQGCVEMEEDISVDGVFGDETEEAVTNIQETVGLSATGEAEGETLELFYNFVLYMALEDDHEDFMEEIENLELFLEYITPEYDEEDPYAEISFDREQAENDGVSEEDIESFEDLSDDMNAVYTYLGSGVSTSSNETCYGDSGGSTQNEFTIAGTGYSRIHVYFDSCDAERLGNMLSTGATIGGSGFLATIVARAGWPAIIATGIAEGAMALGALAVNNANVGDTGIIMSMVVETIAGDINRSLSYWVSSQ